MATVDADAALEALRAATEKFKEKADKKEWIDNLVVVAPKKPEVVDAQDDLKREVALYVFGFRLHCTD